MTEIDNIKKTNTRPKKQDSFISKLLKTDISKFTKVPIKEKIIFTQNLSVMIKTGLPLSKALHTLSQQTKNQKFKEILLDIHNKIEKGTSFAEALKDHKSTFGELFVSMVESGEISGNLEEVLNQVYLQMKKDHEIVSKVKGAMIYPAIVVIAMIGIGIAMMVFVIPKLVSIFDEIKAELPLPTKILIAISDFLTQNGIIALGIFVFIIIVLKLIHKTDKGKSLFHYLILKSPIMGNISRKINLARFSRTMSSLLKTDIPIIKCFEITAKVVGNVHYKKSLLKAAEDIKKGLPISQSVSKFPKLFTPMIIQMITVGEESGEVDTVLKEIASFYEEDIDQTMKNLPQIIEPLLILVLGIGVGAMAVSIIMPLYSLTQNF